MVDGLPAPRTNLTATGLRDRATDVVTSTTVLLAAGDYTGGAVEDSWGARFYGTLSPAKATASATGSTRGGQLT